MGILDVKIEVSTKPFWKIRNQRLQSLKSVTTCNTTDSTYLQTSAVTATSSSSDLVSAEILSEPSHGGLDVSDALYWAAATDDVDAFISVLEQGLTDNNMLQLVTPSGNTLLHVVVIHGCEENVKLLLYHYPGLILKKNIHGDTPLHLAVRNRIPVILFILTDFLNYKQQGHFHEEWISTVGIIPEIEMSIRFCNRKGNTALHEAVIHGWYDAVSLLILQDTVTFYSINNQGKSPMYLMAEAGMDVFFDRMFNLLREVEIEESSIKRLSPLLPAVLKTNKDVIDEALKHEPEFIRLLDEDGKTPLHYAASIGNLDMVKYILGKKVEYAMVRDKKGVFPIHTAAAHGNINVIRELLKYGLGPSELLTHDGQNIVHVAATRGNNNVVRFVLKTLSLEGLINEADIDGNTPLHLATLNWHAKVVFTLTWDKRVDLGCVNDEGFTPLDAAQHYMERPPSFDKRLTWTALKAAGAPESPPKETSQTDPSNPFGTQQPNTVDTNNYKDRVNTLLVVATLVATVTFASSFTVPGGYDDSKSNPGMATMLRHTAFQIFILSDTIAMYSSILVAISLIWAQLGDINLVFIALRIAIPLLGVSLAMMSLAFMSGVYLVVSQLHWLAYIVLITGLAFLGVSLLLFVPLCIPITSKCRVLRYISYYSFLFLILVTSESGRKVT